MKFFFSLLITIAFSFASDATIDVVKKIDSLPTLAVEDATNDYDYSLKMTFFKSLTADMNVLAIFNVDKHHIVGDYEGSVPYVENKDMNYVLRYKLTQGDDQSLSVSVKLLQNERKVFFKEYRVNNPELSIFVSHAIAYDINEYMGEPSVEWMKRKVIFSRIVAPKKSELVISDYTLHYQHVVIKGGFNLFPKWANRAQTGFYYTSLDATPTLKHVDLTTGEINTIGNSEGMMVCSDVSSDGKELLITMAPDGQPDVYHYNLRTKQYRRVTTYGGIDVGGQFFPNDKIVFISSRLGYPNVFMKDLRSKQVEQLVFYGKNNSACSTSGKYVVYKSRETSNQFGQNTFNLHLISTETAFIRRLTATGVNEFPRFSKDGDAIMFIKNYKNSSALGVIRLNHNKNYLFPLAYGKIQSIDW